LNLLKTKIRKSKTFKMNKNELIKCNVSIITFQ
jgi:hypothetical protein